jgi:hypothetical protein
MWRCEDVPTNFNANVFPSPLGSCSLTAGRLEVYGLGTGSGPVGQAFSTNENMQHGWIDYTAGVDNWRWDKPDLFGAYSLLIAPTVLTSWDATPPNWQRNDLFAIGNGNTQQNPPGIGILYWAWMAQNPANDGWFPPYVLPGSPDAVNSANPVAAVSWGPQRYDIFAVSSDGGNLLHWWVFGNPILDLWQQEALDTPAVGLNGSVAAASYQPNRLDVFAVGNDGQLYQWWYDGDRGTPFRQPAVLESSNVESLSVASCGPQRLDVFGLSTQGSLLWWSYNGAAGTSFGPPVSLNDNQIIGAKPAVVSWGRGVLDIFAGTPGVNTPSQMLHWWQDENIGVPLVGSKGPNLDMRLAGLQSPYIPLTTGIATAVSEGPGELDVVTVGGQPPGTRLVHWLYHTAVYL